MIYVDNYNPFSKENWCHMMSDQKDLSELHQMAKDIGLRRAYFQNHPTHPHYDVAPAKRALAIRLGAVSVDSKELLAKCSRLVVDAQ